MAKTMILGNARGDRAELTADGQRFEVVTTTGAAAPLRQRITYETSEDCERAFKARLKQLLSDRWSPIVAPPGDDRAVVDDIPAELDGYVAMIDPTVAMVNLERGTQQLAEALNWARQSRARVLVLDADPHDYSGMHVRGLRVKAHSRHLTAWLDGLSADRGGVEELVFRHCALHELDQEYLRERVEPFRRLTFVAKFPANIACAAHVEELTLAAHKPDGTIPKEVLRSVATGATRLTLVPGDNHCGTFAAALSHCRLPNVVALAVEHAWISDIVKGVTESSSLRSLQTLRADARIEASDVDYLHRQAAVFERITKLTIRPALGSAAISAADFRLPCEVDVLPTSVRPVCVYRRSRRAMAIPGGLAEADW